MRRLSLIGLLLLVAVTLSAESTAIGGRGLDSLRYSRTSAGRGFFRYPQFGHSLCADVHPNFVRMDVPIATNQQAYHWGWENDPRSYRWQLNGLFGFILPVWSGNLVDSTYALSVVMTGSANLWMDMFDFHTSPIVDTDYRVGMPIITFMHRLNKGFFKNYSVMWAPFKHESTHIGDELQIRQVEVRDFALKRVNVSYNYTEFAFTLNEAENRYEENHCIRLGLMVLWGGGWYNIDAEDWGGDHPLETPKSSPWELYLQYQYQSPTSKHGFQGIASAEIRNRALYGYDLYAKRTPGVEPVLGPDSRIFTYNVFMGVRYNTPNYDGCFSRFAFGLRAYHGNCPFGEFRSLRNYSQLGFCMIFE